MNMIDDIDNPDDFRLHRQLSESLRRLKAGDSISDLNREATMRSKIPAIPPPFGAVERSHNERQPVAILGHVTPDSVPHDVVADYAALDRPTIHRRAESTAQGDLDAVVRLIRDTLLVRAGQVADLDWINERARQVTQVLVAEGKI